MRTHFLFRRLPVHVATTTALLLTFAGRCPAASTDPGAPSPPNIVLVSLDTVRADRLGCYGNLRLPTPNLDHLAHEGAQFEYFYSASNFTLATHVSLFSGLHPSASGAIDNGKRFPPQYPHLAETLSESGYRTVGFYDANHFVGREFDLERGFDSYKLWNPINDNDPFWPAVERLAESEEPFFLFVHFNSAHEPYIDPAKTDYRFFRGDAQRFAQAQAMMDTLPSNHFQPSMIETVGDLYDGSLAFIDDKIAQLVEIIDQDPMVGRRTAILVTSDHGQSLGGPRGCCGHGYSMYQEQTRVPLIIRFPGRIPSQVRSNVPASTVDIPVTILKLANLDPSPGTHGVNLLPFIDHPLQLTSSLPVAFSENPPFFAYRSDHWSIVGRYFGPEFRSEDWEKDRLAKGCVELTEEGMIEAWSLHDVRVDRDEIHDSKTLLPDECIALLREVREKMRAGAFGLFAPKDAAERARRSTPLSPAAERSLRAFGYID